MECSRQSAEMKVHEGAKSNADTAYTALGSGPADSYEGVQINY